VLEIKVNKISRRGHRKSKLPTKEEMTQEKRIIGGHKNKQLLSVSQLKRKQKGKREFIYSTQH